MTEEKEEIKSQEPIEEKAAEAPAQKEEAPKAEETNPVAEEAKPAQKEAPVKAERPKECVVCQKSIKKLWYYREGKYFCSKGCWQKSKNPETNPGNKPTGQY